MDNLSRYQSFIELARDRFSCRSYDAARAVSNEDVDRVLEAGRLSPSAVNFQARKFIVIRDPELRRDLLSHSRPAFVDAPVLIVVCSLRDQAWTRKEDGKNHADVDASIAADHITLAATALGLGTCWVCSFGVENVRQKLNLPPEVDPLVLLPLGYPLVNTSDRHEIRKPLSEITEWI